MAESDGGGRLKLNSSIILTGYERTPIESSEVWDNEIMLDRREYWKQCREDENEHSHHVCWQVLL